MAGEFTEHFGNQNLQVSEPVSSEKLQTLFC